MTIKEFKDKLAEEIRNKLRKNNLSTPILDRLELHVKDFEGVSVQDIIGSKNMRHDVYVSFIYQICYPSRIKMDIDENYQPITKKRIAIISCKRRKQDFTCSADEMYFPSPGYRAQREFLIKGYDDYYIISSEYGIIHHTQIIEPYDRAIKIGWNNPAKDIYVGGYKEGLLEQIDKQFQWMKSKGWEIDFHTSKTYFDPLLPETKQKVNHIKQPQGAGAIIPRYEEATNMLDTKSLEECLESIGRKSEKPVESKRWWYHQDYEPFYGTSGELWGSYKKQGIEFDGANLRKVPMGGYKHSTGWVIDKDLLPNLYKTNSGQWRIKKQK